MEDMQDTYNPPRVQSSVTIDREKAEQLVQLYELYRKSHPHDIAFALVWGIEAEGLPF
jgi:hypothetical protein